ncbi:Hvo_1808 family surface protein [Natrinema salaciae]|uniref:PGF-CTERM protein n=1 Tax=Natrinema salaciae TaxID=1186196 RepID=A0A1H9KB73_9EURY|nr:Hvo_1808 family surface protein [Natrinema salaciae]SEQ96143.1 hypothetical protein SAMN04489841_2858 [Natrinema salaciae]
MRSTRTRSSVALLAVLLTVTVVTGGLTGPVVATAAANSGDSQPLPTDPASALAATDASSATQADRPANPTTEDTVGYVAGYWYDDELAVDDRPSPVVDEDELDPIVYRAMARVERIRNVTFDERVDVTVVSRAEYRETNGDRFANLTSGDRLEQNVAYEALFVVDRNTAAADATETLYGDAVAGYYDPGTDQIVLVSENADSLEVNKRTLAHELVHALQDQRFDLSSLGGATQDEELAVNGLVEGDASLVEREYESRCRDEWRCLGPADEPTNQATEINWGLYFTVYHPYSDGPDYVEQLRERAEGWSAVNAAYDDPPSTTSAVIRPSSEREPADVSVPDRSSEDWDQLRVDGEVANDTVGEAGMVAMFAADGRDRSRPAVIEADELFEDSPGSYDYDHPVTNGWAGDELVVYTTDGAGNESEPTAAAGRAGYVWRTEWQSGGDATAFADGYLQLLESHDAESVDGRRDTYVIDDGGYAGAYYLERNETTITIVRAPSVDALSNVEAGAAPEGDDTLSIGDDETDLVPGFGPLIAIAALAVLGTGLRIVVDRG